ncbi:hypothetical protein DID88_006410 [Monilinia fructigena]|uniref:DNA topoisomerase n=1 Tax=Monilinia fructigena TaxID=38457 RepID=A0A395IFY5_9HELO|nr:hypothetical protein DID88_006410 [Monilinia fructigena]
MPSQDGPKNLCVAEKPSIAKAVANHLAGGNVQSSNTGNKYIKNYSFTFDFGGQWGNCNAVMTSVLGHLTTLDVAPSHKNWTSPPPEDLFFGAQVIESVVDDKTSIAQNIKGSILAAKWRAQALKGNPRIEIKRARFSNIERAHVIQAAKRPVNLDQRQIDAVAARIELDLRIGFAFTRFQTNNLRKLGGPLEKAIMSSCQFPTLGFVVDRYPRTETDRFDKGMNLRALVEKQVQDNRWGHFAQNLVNGGFHWPREGRNDDKAHPPIHPVTYTASTALSATEAKIYEFVVRRFLACCSEDAKGQATDVELEPKAGEAAAGNNDDNTPAAGRGGRGRSRERGDREVLLRMQQVELEVELKSFIPTTLGVALVEGYDNMEFEVSLSKPFLRKQMELKMKAICEGQKTRGAVVRESLTQYHRVFLDSKERVDVLKAACRKYVLNNGGAGP